MGTIDLPNTIDYILEKTGEPDLSYVGHSMGTAIFFVLCSERPEYQEKIRSMAAMAPIAYLNHVKSPIMTFLSSVADPLAVSARQYIIIVTVYTSSLSDFFTIFYEPATSRNQLEPLQSWWSQLI